MILFVGIVIWAWSGKNKENFKAAAQIPLEDELDASNDMKERN